MQDSIFLWQVDRLDSFSRSPWHCSLLGCGSCGSNACAQRTEAGLHRGRPFLKLVQQSPAVSTRYRMPRSCYSKSLINLFLRNSLHVPSMSSWEARASGLRRTNEPGNALPPKGQTSQGLSSRGKLSRTKKDNQKLPSRGPHVSWKTTVQNYVPCRTNLHPGGLRLVTTGCAHFADLEIFVEISATVVLRVRACTAIGVLALQPQKYLPRPLGTCWRFTAKRCVFDHHTLNPCGDLYINKQTNKFINR